MKKFLAILILAAATFSVTSAHAILIEPFIGYGIGEIDDGSTKNDVTGVEYGARLGATFTMFAFGGEYAIGDATVDSTPELDVSSTDLGVFFAVEFPILLRAYATYFIDSTSEPDGSADYEGDGGYRVGVGFTGLPFVSINLERVLRKYDKQGSSDIDVEVASTVLSVSLPLP